ncbi:3-deoxy-7-phosphoheptulonate synthase [Veronia pacifica]|uniref:Phospho-2-dehydro-3-deoxyheptonate aldolase n=1 Tax=Veronia pacifica TaxID=1080227 RepID=A0A1C3EB64_9GAMM|nr:3-deoxy-7-phosphoheptulonate synthase [Veronia pacifica]ODA30491.1 3-deoxy-7-phosphoheptulonate synthase [Veronia pacifica]
MERDQLTNIHIQNEEVLITPQKLRSNLPVSEQGLQFISHARQDIANIIHKKDHRLLVVCGPCSIHDIDAAKEYAVKLKELSEKVSSQLYIVMRVYFEKPRTTVGWKGLINDPHLDGSFDVSAGLHKARQLLIELTEMGLPLATEALDPISPQYVGDLFSWAAIGARTTESQTHREMASGLSMPVGFKNGTDGSLDTAINAMNAAASGHRFMGINQAGQVALMSTDGNPDGHVILRGGKQTNYDSVSIAECEEKMTSLEIEPALMVDCSHANSRKDFRRQPLVATDVIHQIREGNRSIIGLMLESHLNEGNQSADLPRSEMVYGVSITDACLGWQETEALLLRTASELTPMLSQRIQ